MSRTSSAPRPTWPTGLIIGVLAAAGLAVAMMQTLLVPLIPNLPGLLDTTPENASWLITVTLLASAVATPSVSRLADMFGKKRMMLVSLCGMLAGSVLGALGTSFALLVTARALQGCAMALIPVGMSIMRDELPREKLGSAVALMSATLGIGAAVGLPLSGLIFTHLGWHAVFWVSAVMAGLLMAAVGVVIRESDVRAGGRFDVLGAVLLSGALVALLLGITKGGHWGWTSQQTLATFLVAAVLFAIWLPWEFRIGQPLVDVRTSVRRPVLLTNIASFLVGFAMYCNMLSTTELLQMPTATGYGFGLTVVQAGLALLPAAMAMVLLAPVSAAITRAYGARITLLVGAGLLAAGYIARVFLMDSVWQVILGAVIVSCGTATAYAAMPVLIMRAVPITETASANGLNTVLRSVGTSTASAAVAALLTGATIVVGGAVLPSKLAFQQVFVLAAMAALAGGAVAFGIPRHSPRGAATEPLDDVRSPGREHEVVAHGFVVDRDGLALEHAVVAISLPSGEPVDWSRSDAEGEFPVALPAPGRYLVTSSAPGWASLATIVEFGDVPPTIRLTEPRALSESVIADGAG